MAKANLPSIPREVRGSVYDTIRKQFSQPTSSKSKSTWTEAFVKEIFKEALDNPNGEIGRLIAKNLLQDDILTSLDQQTEKLLSRDIDFLEYRVIKQCFDKQREILLDKYNAKKIVMTSRRAGKTSCASRLLNFACATPNTPALYLHLKFENAIKQCFEDCIEVAKLAEMEIKRASKSEGIIEFQNGSSISFKGNNDKTSADRLRGGKYKIIIVDEAAFQCNMKYLCEDVCLPMLADFKNSQLMLISTPPRTPHTYFEDCLKQEDFKKYHWTARDNPYIPNFQKFINDMCIKKGIDINSPFIQREFYGELVYDTEAQVYKDAKEYDTIPDGFIPTDCAIGVDFGFSDFNSLVTLIYNRKTAQGFVTETKKFNKSNVSTIVDNATETYHTALNLCLKLNKDFELNKIWLYCDNSDQSISFEMSSKYKLPINNALKYDKKLGIEQLADFLRTGRIKINKDDKILKSEIEQTVYKRDDLDAILPEIDDTIYHPDALDALLYASRQFTYDCELVKQNKIDTSDITEARAKTLPDFMTDEDSEDDSY